MKDDEELPKLPIWKEFRKRRTNEDPIEYLQNKLEADITQERDRDHWFVQVFGAMMNHVELLHNDLMGDGTILRRGVLTQLIEEQQNQATRLAEIPHLIREALVVATTQKQADEWSAVKKWTYGVLSVALATFIGALIWLLVVGK